MLYTQKIGWLFPAKIEIDLQETGFKYKLTQKKFNGEAVNNLFFSYSEITNSRSVSNYTKEIPKNLYLVGLVALFGIFISFAVGTDGPSAADSPFLAFIGSNDRLVLWSIIIASIVFYRMVVFKKMITLETYSGGHFSVFKNDEGEKILNEIIARRNTYMRRKYIEDKINKENLTLETVDWLASLDVVSKDEAVTLT